MDKLLKNKTAIFIFVAPAMILFTVVLFVPILTSFYYALCDYSKVTRSYTFNGIENFKWLAKDPTIRIAFKNSMFFLVFSCISQLIMGILLAGLLTNIKKGRNFFKNVIYRYTIARIYGVCFKNQTGLFLRKLASFHVV